MSDPEHVRGLQTERKRQVCRDVIQRPDVKAKRMAAVEKQRAVGFPGLTYRNGMVTLPQQTLFDALPGAVMEHPFYIGAVGRPSSVDLAIPSLRLAIEIDGHSHQVQQRKEIDAKKEQILKERGWTVLRFSNSEVLRNLPWVVNRIQETILGIRGQHAEL